ncbi:acyl-CoA dehydrogenase family protein [Flavobacteriaceae bacterium]|nr:acyl-CoA dehydrogenase family protein [Flavobacteriaceae bacterium]MDC1060619.1 acyl-CoA dehydrogenase family protein [Flavobacteriaceae bacterium]
MDFSLSEEHKLIQKVARDFAKKAKEGVIERDTKMEYPTKTIAEMGELGFMGIMSSPAYGGSGLDTLSYVLVMEELSKVDASAAVIMSAHNSLVVSGIEKHGSDEVKNTYLRPLVDGTSIGCFCLSEPEAGSDATSQQTTAIDKGDHYILNGVKNWITNGEKADYHLVIAQTDRKKGHRGINAFVVEKSWEGVQIGEKEDKLGIRSSDTHSITYTDVKVPKTNRLGPEGFGFKFAMETLEGGRIGIAAQALGIAAGAYELAADYANLRKAFGKPIIEHQGIAFKLAEMAMEIESARMLVYRAAYLKDQGLPYGYASAMAKLKASEVAMNVTVEAVQVHGGNGYVKEYHVERLMRDAKITQIYEGTSEIQKIVLSRHIAKGNLQLHL